MVRASILGPTRRMMLRGVVPDFQGQTDSISLTVNVGDYPHSTKTAKGPYALADGATKKDFRASGRVMSVKLSGTEGYMRLGKPTFDTVPMGER